MNVKDIEMIAKEVGWFPRQVDIADKILRCDTRAVSEFLQANSIASRRFNRTKIYFLPDVIEAIERTKWK